MKYRLPLLLALLGTTGAAFGLLAFPGRWIVPNPPSGKYTGLLTVRRTLVQEGLETTFTVKAVATIAADGRITILTATPESPGAAANIENSIVRAAPGAPLLGVNVPLAAPALQKQAVVAGQTGTLTTTPPSGSTIIPGTGPGAIFLNNHPFVIPNYVVNGNIPCNLTVANRMVYLKYSVPVQPLPGFVVTPLPSNGVIVANSSPADSSLSVNTSPASQASSTLTVPAVAAESNTRVSYEFALRFQRALPAPTGTVR